MRLPGKTKLDRVPRGVRAAGESLPTDRDTEHRHIDTKAPQCKLQTPVPSHKGIILLGGTLLFMKIIHEYT